MSRRFVLWCLVCSGLLGCGTSALAPSLSTEASLDALDAGPGCSEHASLALTGVTCPACRESVEAKLRSMTGVVAARVTLAPQAAMVRYCSAEISAQQVVDSVRALGYGARLNQ